MSTNGIRPDDIIKVNKRGVEFHAFVTVGLTDGVVTFRPIERNISYTQAKPREIVGHWGKRGRRRSEPRPAAIALAA